MQVERLTKAFLTKIKQNENVLHYDYLILNNFFLNSTAVSTLAQGKIFS
jgi:hypothetical protein